MNRKYRFVLYFLLCLSILTFPYIAEICIDVWVWLSKTIDTNCLIVSLCIAGIFLFMEFLIHTCKKEKKNNADKYKTTVSALYYDSPSSYDIFNRRNIRQQCRRFIMTLRVHTIFSIAEAMPSCY